MFVLLAFCWFCSLWPHLIGDLRPKVDAEGADVCFEGLLFPEVYGCVSLTIIGIAVAQAGLCSQHTDPSRRGLLRSGLSWLHLGTTVWINAMCSVAGDTCQLRPQGPGGCSWPREALNDWPRGKRLSILLLIPSSSQISISSLFFFFFFLKGICCSSCQNISIAWCQQIHFSLLFYTRKGWA